MSANQQTKNVLDFATYRARRNQHVPSADMDHASGGAFVFTALPVMIPIIAWMPVWGLATTPRYDGPRDE